MKTGNILKSKWFFLILSILAFTLLSGAFQNTMPKVSAEEEQTNQTEKRTINVSGDGDINASPDIAYITLGVITEKKTVTDAQAENSVTMNALISSVKQEGIQDSDIITTNYSISPKYNYDDKTGSSSIDGYSVSNTLSVTVKDISKVGALIDSATENGANVSSGIRFGISNYEKYYNMALASAVDNAKLKAGVIADSIGVKLTTAESVTESSSGVPTIPPVYYNTDMKAMGINQSTPVETGTFEVKASVNAVYDY